MRSALGRRTTPVLRASDAKSDCVYRLDIEDGRYSIEGGSRQTNREGRIDAMPVVDGTLRPRPAGEPRRVHQRPDEAFRTSPILRQQLAWLLATIAVILAFVLVAFERRPRPWSATRRLAKGGLRSVRAVDVLVVVVLLSWAVVAPAFYDDGWVWVRGALYSTVGGFSNYYSGFGANLPNDYWLEWLQHWLSQATPALVLLRLPALVCLIATWVLCRWVFGRLTATSRGEKNGMLWMLGAAFLAGALSWGMTLRPEFATSLLAIGVLACVVRFRERAAAAPLVLCAALVPLAVTAHHEGVVSIAPLIVVATLLLHWARRNRTAAAAIVTASAALLVLLAFVGSDLGQRRLEVHAATPYATGASTWLDEIQRYVSLSQGLFASPLRGGSVALMWLAVLAYLVRSERKGLPLDVSTRTLAVGLLLLVPLPDKWIWHFGALLGLGAVAIAAESARLLKDAARARAWQARPFIVIAAGTLASIWAWASLQPWSILDLRTLDWTRDFDRLQVRTLVVLAPLVLLVAASIRGVLRRDPPWLVPWRVAPWTAVIVSVPLIVFTCGVFVADALETSSWTLARQNVDALRGKAGCGVADDYAVALPESAQSVPRLISVDTGGIPSWVPPPPVSGLPRFVLGPSHDRTTSSPWFRVPPDRALGLFVTGTVGSAALRVVWGSSTNGKVDESRTGELRILGLPGATNDAKLANLGTDDWRLFAEPALAARPRWANVVRVELGRGSAPAPALAVTAPVTYSARLLTSLVDHSGTSTLVGPGLALYMPCARAPRLTQGIADVPRYIISDLVLKPSPTPLNFTASPFLGVLDLYPVRYLPVANRRDPIEDFVVFRVDRHVPGGIVAPPTVAMPTS